MSAEVDVSTESGGAAPTIETTPRVVLAVDTATSVVNVAVGRGSEVLAGESVLTERRHAELLSPLIARVMDRADATFADLDAVVACVGPGLFTGLRVGVATARAIASVHSLPVVGVSSLEAMALADAHADDGASTTGTSLVVATLDARRGEVAWASFETGHRISEDRVDPPAAVLGALTEPATILGSGVDRLVEAGLPPGLPTRADAAPTPGAILELGVQALARGESVDIMQLVPNYLRRTDAEINHELRVP